MLGSLLFILFLSPNSQAASDLTCHKKTLLTRDLSALGDKACEDTKKSPQCQQLYKAIQEDGSNLESKQLNCQKQKDSTWLQMAKERMTGCLVGGLLDPTLDFLKSVASLPRTLAEGFEADEQRARECNSDFERKKAIFSVYNQGLPRLLQVPAPAGDVMKSKTCAQLQADLNRQKRIKNRNTAIHVDGKDRMMPEHLTEEEKEYFAWKQNKTRALAAHPDEHLLQVADRKLQEFGVRLECYNPEAAWALSCEALHVAVSGAGGVKVLAKLSGLKATRLATVGEKAVVKTSSNLQREIASLKNLSREERIRKIESQLAGLSEAQKIEKLQVETGLRKLSPAQLDSLRKAHEVGSEAGETFGTYSQASLREKMRTLQAGGWSQEESEFLILKGYAGNPTTKPFTPLKKVSVKDQSLQAELDNIYKKSDGAQADRLAASRINRDKGYTQGVAQDSQARELFQSSAEKMKKDLPKQTPGLSAVEEKNIINKAESAIIESDAPVLSGRPDQIQAWNNYERKIMSTQKKYEDAATMYIRAGQKEEALKIMNQSPVMNNLSTSVGKQNYLNRYLKEAELTVRPEK